MLMLTRKPGQRIMIGADIVVLIDRVNGGQIRVGIEAPKNMLILREELADREAPAPQERHA